ncbi:HAMP domain-containing histidine kinase [Nocardioides dongxiaopingii]|uniref:HAMP domain-containing histidine kinase n=1 Tax=Nocardioides sp. S-1144 TaxID=2582905 RepID=UPI00110E1CAB|nr:HAMP domain-containing histidine kinase [Nocardioides sp. S-1144]QCW49869.1 HAMP domain-containing histidine kinase [Nocardioides sp. S-1144]
MRERLTTAFIAITLLLLVGAGLIRSHASDSAVRAHEAADVAATAEAMGAVISDAVAAGGVLDRELLRPFLTPRSRIVIKREDSTRVVLTGADFDPGAPADQLASAVILGDGEEVELTNVHDQTLEGVWGDRFEVLAVFGLLAILAGVTGYLVARSLSAPFRQLAVAAAALGRGRFDLDLPRGGVPEARAIALALASSATQMRERMEREREFGQHASHVLRTPLTSLRFRLEEIIEDPTLSGEARDATIGCLRAVGRLDQVAGELVELGGRGVLLAGAALPLRDLATQVAQRWADVLDLDHRSLSAAVEGDIELRFTPGPVEQVLDLLLEDVLQHDTGAVRLVFEGAASRLQIDVSCVDANGTRRAPARAAEERIQVVLDSLGGRLERPADGSALRLHLPRR